MRRIPLAVLLLSAATAVSAAPPAWQEVKSTNFTVITNSGQKDAQKVAWQFEQFRGALMQVWPWARIEAGKPFVIVAVRDENTLKTFAPRFWEGKRYRPTSFWVGTQDRNFVVLRTDAAQPTGAGENPYQQAYWSYAHSHFSAAFPRRVPSWYARGIAAVMSNSLVREKEIHIGRPLQDTVELLRDQPVIPLAEFLADDESSRWRTQETLARLYDAQAWALVHYLAFGEQGANAPKLAQFDKLLYQGASAEDAIKGAFGDLRPYYDATRPYLARGMFGFRKAPLAPASAPDSYTTRVLSPAEAAAWRGHVLVANDHPLDARAAAAEAAAADASLAAPWEIEAEILDREDKDDAARAAYAKATAAGSTRAHVYYRLAQLEWKSPMDDALKQRLSTLLEKAQTLEPRNSRVLAFLAEMRRTTGRAAEAVDLATRAVQLEPTSSYNRRVRADALLAAGRKDEAVSAARGAVLTADTPKEKEQAAETLADVLGAQGPAPAPGPAAPPAAASPAPGDKGASTRNLTPAPGQAPVTVRLDGGGEVTGMGLKCFTENDDAACAKSVPDLDRSCTAGQAVACRSLGSLYDGGFGVKVDKARAASLYDRGCGLGDQPSCARHALLQFNGHGVARDPGAGMATLQRLCNASVDDACIGWSVILARSSDPASLAKARTLLSASCARGVAEACRLRGTVPH